MSRVEGHPSKPQLPRLLYFGDVPVESYLHGSALLFRLFEDYPADRLVVVEGYAKSDPERRLRGVAYKHFRPFWARILQTRLGFLGSLIGTTLAPVYSCKLRALTEGYSPQAVISVLHGYGWITAAKYAAKNALPFHLIVHDEWCDTAGRWNIERSLINQLLKGIYPNAKSRLLISPAMAAKYEVLFGSRGDVLYPSRSKEAVDAPIQPVEPQIRASGFTVVYAGFFHSEYMRALVRLALALEAVDGQLLVFGDGPSGHLAQLRETKNVSLRGRVSSHDLIAICRAGADVVYIPMSYRPEDRQTVELGFPSKLADATAMGLPLLIDGPSYCSAVRWARENDDCAEIVTEESPNAIRNALDRLQSASRRVELAIKSTAVGNRCFSWQASTGILYDRLSMEAPEG